MKYTPVQSSNIKAVGYEPSTQLLSVQFNNDEIYNYLDVPQELYDGLIDAVSKGGYLNSYIKPTYRVVKVGWKSETERLSLGLKDTLRQIKESKPNDRSDADRNYAIVIRDLEKVSAYFDQYILRAN